MRKIKQWLPVSAEWLEAHRAELLNQGFTEQDLNILQWHDVEKKAFNAIGRMMGRSRARAFQIYHRARRRLCHPMRASIVLAEYRAKA